jgi:hypothetical protein
VLLTVLFRMLVSLEELSPSGAVHIGGPQQQKLLALLLLSRVRSSRFG